MSSDNMEREGTLRNVSSETESLRKQMSQLKCLTDSAHSENRFAYLINSIPFKHFYIPFILDD